MNAARAASAKNRHRFQVVLTRSDLRTQSIAGAAPQRYASDSANGLTKSNPNIIGIPLSDSECDSLRISTWSAVASAIPKVMTEREPRQAHARSGSVVGSGVHDSRTPPITARSTRRPGLVSAATTTGPAHRDDLRRSSPAGRRGAVRLVEGWWCRSSVLRAGCRRRRVEPQLGCVVPGHVGVVGMDNDRLEGHLRASDMRPDTRMRPFVVVDAHRPDLEGAPGRSSSRNCQRRSVPRRVDRDATWRRRRDLGSAPRPTRRVLRRRIAERRLTRPSQPGRSAAGFVDPGSSCAPRRHRRRCERRVRGGTSRTSTVSSVTPSAPCDLDRGVDRLEHRVRDHELDRRDLVARRLGPVLVDLPCGVQRQQPGAADLGVELGHPVLHDLAVGERAAVRGRSRADWHARTSCRRHGRRCRASACSGGSAPGPSRSWAITKPPPSVPSRFDFGTRQDW